MSILITALLTIWAIVAVVMILVILMQRPKSEGLGAAFGGGVTENIFGAQTTNVLVKFTTYLAAFFFVLTFVLSVLYAHQSSTKSVLREELLKRESTASGAPPKATQSPATSASVSPGASPQASVQPPSSTPAASTAPSATAAAQPSPKKP